MKISVIVPVYNVEKYIQRCITSILDQTLQDFELIIVNDATPDKSMMIINELARQDKRIRILENDSNKGLMWTRRAGYTVANGDYIVFCDSDDYLPLNALQILYNEIIKSDSDIVVADYTYYKTNGQIIYFNNKLSFGYNAKAVYSSLLISEISHSMWSKIYRRSLLQDHNYITYSNHTNSEDAILFYQLINNTKKITCIETSVYNYMQNAESSTRRKLSPKQMEDIIKSFIIIEENCKNNSISEKNITRKLVMDMIKLNLTCSSTRLPQQIAKRYKLNYLYRFNSHCETFGIIRGFCIYCLINYNIINLFIIHLIKIRWRLEQAIFPQK